VEGLFMARNEEKRGKKIKLRQSFAEMSLFIRTFAANLDKYAF